MRLSFLIPCCLAVVLLPVLSAQKIETEFDQAADFSQFKTFRIFSGKVNNRNPSLNNDLVRKQIDAAIRARLAEKGLTEAPGSPDLNVLYTLGAGSRREVEAYPAGWRGLGTRRVAVRYAEGTLIINLRDTKKRELVWRAIAVEEQRDPLKIQKHLDDMVRKSLDKYPPKK